MRFWLLDAIRSYEPGVQLTAIKNVALTEEYLADHFPEFPVLPGVFMLEAATQAAAWLLRLSEDFAHSIICLKEAKNIKYADFVPPGQTLDGHRVDGQAGRAAGDVQSRGTDGRPPDAQRPPGARTIQPGRARPDAAGDRRGTETTISAGWQKLLLPAATCMPVR